MSLRFTVEVPDAVVEDIDRAVAEGRFPDRDAAIRAAVRALADPEVSPLIRSRERPPTLAELRSQRDLLVAIADRHGASNIRVYGSVARGEATEGSDVDLLVDLGPGRSLLDLGGLLMDLQELLGVPVDIATDVKPRIRERVRREAVAL